MSSALEKKFKLNSEEKAEAFQSIIESKITNDTTVCPVEKPTVIIIGGQPGAGKTFLQTKAAENLNKNAIICDADELRKFHDHADFVLNNHPDIYTSVTSCSDEWKNDLAIYGIKRGYNCIIETTFSKPEKVNELITKLRQANSNCVINIYLMAVPEIISLLGIIYREQLQIEKNNGKGGKKVPWHVHEKKFMEFREAVIAVEAAKLYDNIYVFERAITKMNPPTNDQKVELIVKNPASLKEILDSVHVEKSNIKQWPAHLTFFFQRDYWRILKIMKKYSTTEKIAEYIELMKQKTRGEIDLSVEPTQ